MRASRLSQLLHELPGHWEVDVLAPSSFSPCRASSRISRWHRGPRFQSRPEDWLRRLGRVLRDRRPDLLLPPHDEVFLLARVRRALSKLVPLAIPRFEAVDALQDKVRFQALSEDLDIPTPRTTAAGTCCEPLVTFTEADCPAVAAERN